MLPLQNRDSHTRSVDTADGTSRKHSAMPKSQLDISYFLKYVETFAILRNALNEIVRSGKHPKVRELAAYIGAESQPLSPTLRKYIATRIASPQKARGRPQTQSVGDLILQGWCCEIYDEVHQADKVDHERAPSFATRDRIAEALNVSPATIGRWATRRKSNIKK